MATSNSLNLALKIRADIGQAYSDLQKLASGISGTGDAAARAASDYSKAAQGVRSISDQLARMQGFVASLAGAGLGIGGASALIRLTDEYGQMESRIRMVTKGTTEYEMVQQRLLQTADKTYRSLEEAQEVYIRTADSLKSLGYNTEQALDVTESLSLLFVTNATSSERAASAMDAFSRALQTGKVDSLAWRTILMAVPSVVENIAASTGKTTEEIRRLGASGKLTLTDLTEGLRLSNEEIAEAANAMPTTVGDAFTRLRTALQVYFGEANKATGATGYLVTAIEKLKDNLDGAATAVQVLATAYAGRLLASMHAKYAADVAGARAALGLANSELQVTKTIVARTAAEYNVARATLLSARASVVAAEAALARAQQIGTQVLQTRAVKLQTERHTAALHALAAAEAQATTAGNARTAALGAQAAATAVVRNATTAATAAASIMGRTLGAVATAGRGLLALFGGLPGLAITAGLVAAQFFLFRDSAKVAYDSLLDLAQPIDEIKKKFEGLSETAQKAELGNLKEKTEEAKAAARAMGREMLKAASDMGSSSLFSKPAEDAQYLAILIKDKIGQAAQGLTIDYANLARQVENTTSLSAAEKREWIAKIAELERAVKEYKNLEERQAALAKLIDDTTRAHKGQNVELKKIQTPKELLEQARHYETLAKAIKKTRDERLRDAEAAAKTAAALRESGQDLAQAAKDKAANMRMQGLSEEERQIKATQQAHFALNRARMAGNAAQLALQNGDMAAADAALKEAEQKLQSAMQFAEQSGNDKLVESIGREQKKNKNQQADREDSKAEDAMREALTRTKELQEKLEEIDKLRNIALTMDGAEEALATIDSIMTSLEALPTEKTISITTNYVSNGTPPPLGGDAPGFARGGILPGHSPHDRADNLLFMGTAGEYVVRRSVTRQAGALLFLEKFNRLGMQALSGIRNQRSGIRNAAALALPRISIPEQVIAALPRFADGGLLPTIAPASVTAPVSNLAPTILNFPGMGEYPAQMTVDVQGELVKALKREALRRGRR